MIVPLFPELRTYCVNEACAQYAARRATADVGSLPKWDRLDDGARAALVHAQERLLCDLSRPVSLAIVAGLLMPLRDDGRADGGPALVCRRSPTLYEIHYRTRDGGSEVLPVQALPPRAARPADGSRGIRLPKWAWEDREGDHRAIIVAGLVDEIAAVDREAPDVR